MLGRKLARALEHWGGDEAEALTWVDQVVERMAELGYVNDSQYALTKARRLHERGRPARAVRGLLAAKGVESEDIDAALARLAEQGEGGDLAAAITFARRRRLGPFRAGERAADRSRDLAALARAGFSYDIASRVIDADDVDSLCAGD